MLPDRTVTDSQNPAQRNAEIELHYKKMGGACPVGLSEAVATIDRQRNIDGHRSAYSEKL